MCAQRELVEKPPHIDERRMRHISDADLFAALDLSRPDLAAVGAAAARADWPAAFAAWGAYFAQRARPVPTTNTIGYAAYLRDHDWDRARATIASGERLWTEEVDFTDRAKGKSGLYGFHYMGWMIPLIDAYALTGDERHVETFARLFNQWYDTRDQVHGEWPMDVVWYTLGLSIRTPLFSRAYHTFRHSAALDAATQGRILKTVLGAARWLAEEHDSFRYGNWQHHGGTGLFELATFWPEFREAPNWADLAWQRLLDHLELDVYADGGHLERAPSYHTGVLDGYRRVALGAELNWHRRLQDQPRFHEMFRWLMAQGTPLGVSTNFNDSGPVWIGPYLAQGAVLFANPELKWLAERLGTPAEIARTLSQLPDRPDGKTAAAVFAALPSQHPTATSTLLPVSKFAIMRGGWERDNLYLAVSYGPHVRHELESHSHLDPLSFIASGRGLPLAIEAGCPDTYDDPGYHDWYQAAVSHNVVLVDEAEPAPDGKDAELQIWATSPVADVFQAEHAGYQRLGVRHRRTIVFLRDDCWLVHDELTGDAPHRFAWQLFTPNQVSWRDGAYQPVEGRGLLIQPVLPGAEPEPVCGAMVVVGAAAYEGTTERREVDGIRLVRDGSSPRTCFFTLLAPVDAAGDDHPGANALPVSGGTGEAAAIAISGGRDVAVIAGGDTSSELQVGDWRGDGRVWVVRSHGAWMVCDGSRLTEGGTSHLAASSAVDAIACWPDGDAWAGEVTARRRTTIRFGGCGQGRRTIVNGVVTPPLDASLWPGFLLPAAGNYRFRIE